MAIAKHILNPGRTRRIRHCGAFGNAVRILFFYIPAALPLFAGQVDGLKYCHTVRDDPRPLHVHVLQIDLEAPGLELKLQFADPPKEGEGDMVLTDPFELAERGGFIAAVNTNPWSMVGESRGYVAGRAARRLGWIVSNGENVSAPGINANFWLDKDGLPHIGNVSEPVEGARLAIEGFSQLMLEGEIVAGTGTDYHPRTAIGYDMERRMLIIMVVDGRMKGISEGVNKQELALLMEEFGCWEALNLDGGGSSIMLMRTDKGYRRMDTGIYGYRRPLPMLLGVVESD